MITLLMILVLAAVLAPLIQRDLRRAVIRRRRRLVFRSLGRAVVTITLDTRAFNAAMRKAAVSVAELERSVSYARAAFKAHGTMSGRFRR